MYIHPDQATEADQLATRKVLANHHPEGMDGVLKDERRFVRSPEGKRLSLAGIMCTVGIIVIGLVVDWWVS